jgi:hypothetical protein
MNKKGWDEAPWGATRCQEKVGDSLELFCFLFCNTEAFGNSKPKELLSDCWIDSRPANRYLNATRALI